MKRRIIAISNQKGGVGKTISTINIGAALCQKGYRVLVIDLDPQASLTKNINYESDGYPTITNMMESVANGTEPDTTNIIRHSNDNLFDFIPSSITLSGAELFLVTAISRETVLKRILSNPTFNNYDYIVIDCLPSLGILLINALAAADEVIIPVQADKMALDGIELLLQVINIVQSSVNPYLKILGVLPTMTSRTNMSNAIRDALSYRFQDKVFDNHIKRLQEIADAASSGKAIVLKKNSVSGNSYTKVAEEIIRRAE